MNKLSPPRKKVLIVQQVFKQYRLAFFLQLSDQLASKGIELTLCFSLPQGVDVAKADNITTPPAGYARLVPLRRFGPLVWQQVPDTAAFDLVIVEQANRHLLNYLLLLQRLYRRKPKLVFWGHGFNHQAAPGLWSFCKEYYKKCLLQLPDGFFAYTQAVADYAVHCGVAPTQITVLNNSIDTRDFSDKVQLFRSQRNPMQLPPFTLLFCGALYPDKQLSLLLQTAQQLVELGLVSRLLLLGDGPDRPLVEAEQRRQQSVHSQTGQAPWLDYRGACFGDDKAQAYAQADLVLHPGLLGLAVLDAFAAGLPVITTNFSGHSPELAYLQHGYNGLIVPAPELTSALQNLLQSEAGLAELAQGAQQSAQHYSLAAMVNAFTTGVCQLLAVKA
jgi:glycosyltransferase involved in cell wall biosynthesis